MRPRAKPLENTLELFTEVGGLVVLTSAGKGKRYALTVVKWTSLVGVFRFHALQYVCVHLNRTLGND
jgi:hypothetical protein